MNMPDNICPTQNLLGECVLWDHRTGKLQWTDIESSRFWQWDLSDAAAVCVNLPQRLGSFALTPDPDIFLGAFENGFARFSVIEPLFEMLAPVTQGKDHLRMNDGRVDARGFFWAGSMAESPGAPLGSLWRYEGLEKTTAYLDNVRIPNSLCWSKDGKIMYFADSPENTIWTYPFDPEQGPVGQRTMFAHTPPGIHPDGSCVDSENCLWNAQWGAGELVRYWPDGTIERRLPLPVSQPSCVTFAGPDLDMLCITSARLGLDAKALARQPLAGSLLVYRVGVAGRQENICDKGLQ